MKEQTEKLSKRYKNTRTLTADITSPFTVLGEKWGGLTLIWIIDI